MTEFYEDLFSSHPEIVLFIGIGFVVVMAGVYLWESIKKKIGK